MSLRVYNRKRKFDETPEPKGKKAKSGKGNLRFVVQMHDASRLHFDFRLEFDGVFKSWAVPKGPSLNPLDQRLAIFVEDHPIEYGSFEGIIPSGNYGAGTVMVWDEGTYVERGSESRKDSEAAMIKNFDKGHITFVLQGKKLKGEFALIKLKKDESEKAWLLVKKRDQHSTYKRSEIPPNRSVKTGRTIEEITAQAENDGDVWLPKKGRKEFEKNHEMNASKFRKRVAIPLGTKAAEASQKKSVSPKTKVDIPGSRQTPLPRKNKPMLATLSRQPIEKDWIFEPRPDGLRALCEIEGPRVSMYSKAGLPFEKKFPQIVEELKSLKIRAVFDGEVVKSTYYVFDLLYWQERDLRSTPLRERRQILAKAFTDGKFVKHVGSFKTRNQIAKNPASLYKSGTTADWRIVEESVSKALPQREEGPRLTNLDKVFFPKDDITKGDLIDYYRSIAPYILPYLKDRPESLNRQPNGIAKPGFYQKDMTGHIPRWLKTTRVFSESADKSIDYVLCQDERSLLYMINLGCIEIHPWFSRVGHLDHPDFLVIDLDPDGNSFEQVMQIARDVHHILDQIGATNVCKTSGATGIHIGVPTGAKYDFDTVRAFAEDICKFIAKKNPALTSIDRNPNRRRKKIYLDYMQNRRGQTLAAPFCVRPHPGAPVSMPLTWDELKKGLKPEQFHLRNALSRIRKMKDPWNKVLGDPVDLPQCAKNFRRKFLKD